MNGKRKKLLLILFTVALVAGTFLSPLGSPGKASAADFAGGSGTDQSPYIITTAAQLDAVRNDLSAYYKLGNAIDLSGIANWEPINYFAGSFDGAGHTITGLTINRSENDFIGLFGYIYSGSKISNVGLLDVDVTGKNYAGGLVGESWGNITNSYVVGSVKGATNVGGLVGLINDGAVQTSYASGSVTGVTNVGGLAGKNDYQLIESSYANNNVTGQENVGGLAGSNSETVKNSYAAGIVTGGVNVGGLVGVNGEFGSVQNSYAGGVVTGDADVGGLIGLNGDWGSIQNSFYDKDISGQSDTGKGQPLPTDQMKIQSTYTFYFWDFNTIWFMRDGEYPKLRAFETKYTVAFDGNGSLTGTVPVSVNHPEGSAFAVPGNPGNLALEGYIFTGWNTEADGSGTKYAEGDSFVMNADDVTLYAQWMEAMTGAGTADDPYIITTAEELDAVRLDIAAFYKLGNDIDLGAYTDNWKPIGGPGMYKDFSGGLDGAGYVIHGLKVSKTSNFAGLFGIIAQNGEVNRVRLTDVDVSGSEYVGGLAGLSHGIIMDSYAVGSVKGTGNYVGGLAGSINRSAITGSYFSGSVEGGSYVGGLVGNSEGYYPDNPLISNSYAMASVTGTGDYVGGLLGGSQGATTLSYSYAVGSVAGNGGNVGGLYGNSPSTSAQNHYDKEIAGLDDGIQARTTAQMKTKSTYFGWNFDTIWSIQEGVDYPKLRVFEASYTITYDGNGSTTGIAPTDNNRYPQGVPVTVMDNTGGLALDGYTFSGWNTEADGSGTDYAPGDSFDMGTADVTLYAQWTGSLTYTIDTLADQTLADLTEGYVPGMQETRTITIARTGTGHLTNLAVSLSGGDVDDFELAGPAATTLNDGTPSTTFTVKAKDHLPAGTYNATVTVSADHLADVVFTVKQIVHAKKVTKGDANGDGVITPADALMITQYLAGKITLTAEQFDALDMNGDGVLNSTDVQMIMAIYLGGQ